VDFQKNYDLYEFNDVYDTYDDAYLDIEKNMSDKRGIETQAQLIKNIVDELEDHKGDDDGKELDNLIKEGNNLVKSMNNFIKEKYNDKDSIEI
jgi:hypothetical protein